MGAKEAVVGAAIAAGLATSAVSQPPGSSPDEQGATSQSAQIEANVREAESSAGREVSRGSEQSEQRPK